MRKGMTVVWGALTLSAVGAFGPASVIQADGVPVELNGTAAVENSLAFTGKIERVELEGGFWGIVTDDGRRLDPGKLPAAVQVDGLPVQGQAKMLTDVMTVRMWGTPVELLEIKAAP